MSRETICRSQQSQKISLLRVSRANFIKDLYNSFCCAESGSFSFHRIPLAGSEVPRCLQSAVGQNFWRQVTTFHLVIKKKQKKHEMQPKDFTILSKFYPVAQIYMNLYKLLYIYINLCPTGQNFATILCYFDLEHKCHQTKPRSWWRTSSADGISNTCHCSFWSSASTASSLFTFSLLYFRTTITCPWTATSFFCLSMDSSLRGS